MNRQIQYVYIKSEPGLYTVGFYDPSGKWQPESDHSDSNDAEWRVHWLNGGNHGLPDSIETLRTQIKELRRQIGFKDETLARKNRELDALHYVWCDGGCDGGVHRWQDAPMTEEIIADAERNTRRLRAWWINHLARKELEQPAHEE